MNIHRTLVKAFILLATCAGVFAPAEAGLWDDPKNLKVLPEDISPAELRNTMRGFAINTGSRCFTCHVGEDENDLSTYDFSLDDKEKKIKARAMLRMVQNIRSYLSEELDKSPEDLVRVDCATCHRGQNKPEMLQDVLARAYRENGMENAIAEYRTLREHNYGGYSFDFSEGALNMMAERMAQEDELDAALGFLDLNLEFYPQSVRTLVLQGQVLAAKGDKPAARESYVKALALEPDNMWTKRLLDKLDAG